MDALSSSSSDKRCDVSHQDDDDNVEQCTARQDTLRNDKDGVPPRPAESRNDNLQSQSGMESDSNPPSLSVAEICAKHDTTIVTKRSVEPTTTTQENMDSSSTHDSHLVNEEDIERDNAPLEMMMMMMMPSSRSTRPSSLSSIWPAALFSITTVLLFADQNLMAPNLTAIADDFGFGNDPVARDTKLGGDIAVAFFIVGAPVSLLIGCCADSWTHRSALFAGTVGLGEGACLATYWTRSYWQLYLCRVITGISMGGALPLIYSILGDLFPADQRHAVNSVVGIGTGMGIALGQGIAGFVGPVAGWRLPFVLVSVPALFCAVLVLLTVPDPPRGAMEAANISLVTSNRVTEGEHHATNEFTIPSSVAKRKSSDVEMTLLEVDDSDADPLFRHLSEDPSSSYRSHDGYSMDRDERWTSAISTEVRQHTKAFAQLVNTPSVLLALLQGPPGCIPWGIVNIYMNDYLAQDCGMTVQRATSTILAFGFGNFLGMLLGGAAGSWLYRLDCRFPALLSGMAAVVSCIPMWILLNGVNHDSSILAAGFVAVMAGCASGVTGPIIKATLQNVTLPQMRGQAFAVFNTFDDFGRGLGPVFVAALIRQLGGRRRAFNWGVAGWILCGAFNLGIYATIQHDERYVQELLRAQQQQQGQYEQVRLDASNDCASTPQDVNESDPDGPFASEDFSQR